MNVQLGGKGLHDLALRFGAHRDTGATLLKTSGACLWISGRLAEFGCG